MRRSRFGAVPLLGIADHDVGRPVALRLDEARAATGEELVEADLAIGRPLDALTRLQAHVAVHPLRERPRGQLMLALYQSGRQADALAAYRQIRALLRDEIAGRRCAGPARQRPPGRRLRGARVIPASVSSRRSKVQGSAGTSVRATGRTRRRHARGRRCRSGRVGKRFGVGVSAVVAADQQPLGGVPAALPRGAGMPAVVRPAQLGGVAFREVQQVHHQRPGALLAAVAVQGPNVIEVLGQGPERLVTGGPGAGPGRRRSPIALRRALGPAGPLQRAASPTARECGAWNRR